MSSFSSPEEKQLLSWGTGKVRDVAPAFYHQLIETQAERTPDAPALYCGDEEWTYRQLNSRANQLASFLQGLGVGPEVTVGLALDRSPELVVGILGVLKAGGAYLSLDPGYPVERLDLMVQDSGTELILTQWQVAESLPASSARRLFFDDLASQLDGLPGEAPPSTVQLDNLAYVIYTSGSTGRPKGVMVPHRGLANLSAAQRELFGAGAGKRVLQFAPPSFDASVFEVLMALATGASLVLVDRDDLVPGPHFSDLLEDRRITHVTIPPSVLAAVSSALPGGGPGEERLRDLENVVCAGEALPASLVESWAPGRRMFNAYGPTEATVWSSVQRCSTEDGKPSIGGPVPNIDLRVVDTSARLAAVGQEGELWIGGPGLARGYLGRPRLTAERFVPDPFATTPGGRLYRSGDVVRLRSDGRLDFAGRVDHQVKIHGHRIEPGEIADRLDRHPAIDRSFVMAREDTPGAPRLVAYVVPDPGFPGETLPDLRAHLGESLPGYMVPAAVVSVDELPLTANGKVDRKALPMPEPSAADLDEDFVAPRSPEEEALATVAAGLLGLERVGVHEDFFALGGHSLLVGQLVARGREILGAEISLKDVYEAPTVAGLAAAASRVEGRRELPPIRRVERDRPAPLSFPQERVWFLNELAEGNLAYNSQATIEFHGPLDPAVFQRVLAEIVRRHEVYRSTFPAVDGRPVQIVLPSPPVPLPLVDLRGLPHEGRAAHGESLVHNALKKPFDLQKPPLARWTLLRLAPEHYVLIQVEHHFVHDGWAFGLLMREIKALYTAFVAGRPSPLPEPPVQGSDFAVWQREWLQGEVLEEYLTYWTEKLQGSPPFLELPTDHPRPRVQSFVGDALRIEIPEAEADALRQLARGQGVTLFTVMLSGFKTLLARISGEGDLLIGTAAANRRIKEVELMMGMVVNTLILRSRLTPKKAFSGLLKEIQDTSLGAFAYQDMPLDKLVERLDPERDLSRNPLFQVMFSFHDSPVPDMNFAGLEGKVFERHNGSAKSDLNIVGIPRAEQRLGLERREGAAGITLIWEYSTALFEKATMQRMVGHYRNLLAATVENPHSLLADLPFLSVAERRQLTAWNETAAEVPKARGLQELFEAAADRNPDALAIASPDYSLTYGELDARANQLARFLRGAGVGTESIVALCIGRSPELPAAALGVLKAGGAYLPLDPSHPPERIAFTLEDSGVALLLASEALPEEVTPQKVRTVLVDRSWKAFEAESMVRLSASSASVSSAPALDPLRRAYIIYTSGSTGRPKGTELSHGAAMNLVGWHCRDLRVVSSDRATLVASPAFDASVWETWPYLAAGASLYIPPEEIRTAPEELYRWLEEKEITLSFLPTLLGEALLEKEAPPRLALRSLLVGGDRLQKAPRPGLPFRVVNNYGPTEDAVVSTSGTVPPGDSRVPSIGRPIANTRTHVLDRRLRPVPVRVPGELFVAGAGLARGYLGRPSLTAESFLPHPFALAPGQRLYRTGDRVRFRTDGEIEFLGRTDHQVKIRGFRIELGEIEAVLMEQSSVGAAVVLPAKDGNRLMAFVVPAEGNAGKVSEVCPTELREALQVHLPDYMVPAAFEVLEELPVSPTGKVDRQALASVENEVQWGDLSGAERRAPRSMTEELLGEIWKGVLGRRDVGVHEDFFAIGGHSLLATQVVSRVRDVFHVELPLQSLFEASTVEALAKVVDSLVRLGVGAEAGPLLHTAGSEAIMSFAQERMWFLDQLITDRAAYHIARAYRFDGSLKVAALEAAIRAVVERHDSLRTRFSELQGKPMQVLEETSSLSLPLVDLSGLGDDGETEATRLRHREGRRPFDLRRCPLLRFHLLRLAHEDHQLLLTQHHIITDGWSTGIVLREMAALYEATVEDATRIGNSPPTLPPMALTYADFAVWQREWMQGDVRQDLVAYWKEALAGAPAVLELPLDRPRPTLQSFRGAQIAVRASRPIAEGLEELSRGSGVTWFMTLLAAFATLLSRSAGQRELVVGTPVAGRGREEVEDLVGLFVNTLALRLRLDGEQSFVDLLRQTREVTVGALAHQDLPFEKLVEELAPDRDLSHAPVFQTLFVPGDPAMDRLTLPGLDVGSVPVRREESQFDLALFVEPSEDGLEIALRYDTALFDGTTILRLAGQLETLLAGVAKLGGADQRIDEVPLLTRAQRHAVVVEWNDRLREIASDLCMHELFEKQVEERPEAVAVATAQESLTYQELNLRANRLAHLLRQVGAGPGHLVGVHLDRRMEMLVAVLGVLKSGAAYVPLENTWPAERIRWILSHRNIDVLVTQGDKLETFGGDSRPKNLSQVVCMDSLEPVALSSGGEGPRLWSATDLDAMSEENPTPWVTPEDLAYIIFTSGSTGTPKGVMVRHRPVINLIQWVESTFAVGPDDCLLYTTALSFDLSVYDIFGTLATGGTVRLASERELEDPQRLVNILLEESVTFWDSAPAALQRLAPFFPRESSKASLRLVFLSGDWIPVGLPDRIRQAFPLAQVVSLGGATEATVWSNVFPIGEVDPDWTSIPYGRPIDNGRYHVLDGRMNPCPVGVAGDLYIGGEVLSMGYAGEARMTALQYLPDPFNAVSPLVEAGGSRLYRTGDRARFWNDGVLEFLGRQDTQVKVRGYRIELGEIEAVLREHPRVAEAVVLVREDHPGDQRLVAYLTANEGTPEATFDELRRRARTRLPEYMVPTAFVAVETWPVTATGKLDRKVLPSPEEARKQSIVPPGATPRTTAERIIADVWKEVIGLDSVGTDDNFFDLGGHSLLMARVHTRLQEVLPYEITMADLFRYPTVADLAEAVAPEGAELEEEAMLSTADATATPATGSEESRQIAIIGMAGRFAGARDVGDFWNALREGQELIRSFTDDELRAAGVPEEDLQSPKYVKSRGMLPNHHDFDAGFFDYSPREAEIIDPQQRLFLETAWHALEDAGYPVPEEGSRVGVFAGVSPNGYIEGLMADRNLLRAVGGYQIAISNNADYLPTRVSYKLNLQGPSMTVQTACSTSLVATHLACRALLANECELALAGGACVRAVEERGYFFEEGGIASPDGHTRTFSADASGTVGGSGVGAVVLKRLDHALRDGDAVYAVIRGSAVNNDGSRKVGFTAPSVEGQVKALRAALDIAQVAPSSVGYIEAHGTATPMGDPIEVTALNEVFGGDGNGGLEGPEAGRCALGSVKTNVGHLDAAAGVAGLIKATLSLHHKELVPSLYFDEPNPQIDFSAGPFAVSTTTRPWNESTGPRRAGVSSFGIGGTNAHLVLEEAPSVEPSQKPRPVQLLLLSARTEAALEKSREGLADHLLAHSGSGTGLSLEELADTAFTLQVGRRAMPHRRFVVCADGAEAIAGLRGDRPRWTEARDHRPGRPSVVFLFPGQGAQYAGMARQLYDNEVVFRDIVDQCLDLLLPELGEDLRPWLFPDSDDAEVVAEADRELARTSRTQPALFVVEFALARLWMSWGVRPAALLGHSIGELVAATLSGIFELEDALQLVALRGRLMESCEPGSMAAVALSEEALQATLQESSGEKSAGAEGTLALAAVNGPEACVVSGSEEEIDAFLEHLGEQGVEVQRLHTSHAFHSAKMDPILEDFEAAVELVDLRKPTIPFLSNLTGTWIRDDQAQDPSYWARQLRGTVRFAAGLEEALTAPGRVLLEVGPGRQLSTLAKRHGKSQEAALIQTCLPHPKERGRDEETLMAAVGQLWLVGVEPQWKQFHGEALRRRVHLPGYPFDRSTYSAGLRSTATPDGAPVPGELPSVGHLPDHLEMEVPVPAPQGAPGEESLTETQASIASVWKEMLGIERVRPHDDFFDLGGSSLMAIRLGARLEETLGVEMPASFLLETPTLEDLAERIDRAGAEHGEKSPPSCMVPLQKRGAGLPLFLVHQVGGQAYTFRALAKALGEEQPIYALRSLGLEGGEEPLETVEAMASHYLELVRSAQPEGPYRLGGASMGGMVAYEMAQQLLRAGEEVAQLVVMDTPCLDQMPEKEDEAIAVAAVFAAHTGVRLDLEELRQRSDCSEERLDYALAEARKAAPDAPLFSPSEARRLVGVLQANADALYAYRPKPYDGGIVLFRAQERRPGDPQRPELAWIRLALGGLDYVLTPGNHLSMHEPPQVQHMANHLRRRLNASASVQARALVAR